jgi:hypothetical protein
MLVAMRRAGIRVATVVLRDRRDATRLDNLRVPLVVVDTIAAPLAAPHLARLGDQGTEIVALCHMRLGALVLARRADRVIAVSRALADELRIRLGVAQSDDPSPLVRCAAGPAQVDVSPPKGTIYKFRKSVSVALRTSPNTTSRPVVYDAGSGTRLTIELDGLDLRLSSTDGAPLKLC